MAIKMTNESFLDKLRETNPNVIPLETYVNSTTKILVGYDTCSHKEYKLPSKLFGGQGCGDKVCRNNKLSTHKVNLVKNQNIKKIEDLGYQLLSEYKGRKFKILVKNSKCGHKYEVSIGNVLKGSGCPDCHGIKDTEKFVKEISLNYSGKYEVLGEYVNNRTPIRVKHIECGHIWDVIPKDLLRSEMCPNCIMSKGERYVKMWLEENDIQFVTQRIHKDCKYIRPLPFDFEISVNGRFALIEFDGSQHFEKASRHWGINNGFESVSRNDNIKNKFCEEHEIPLLRIPYWWLRTDKIDRELTIFINGL